MRGQYANPQKENLMPGMRREDRVEIKSKSDPQNGFFK